MDWFFFSPINSWNLKIFSSILKALCHWSSTCFKLLGISFPCPPCPMTIVVSYCHIVPMLHGFYKIHMSCFKAACISPIILVMKSLLNTIFNFMCNFDTQFTLIGNCVKLANRLCKDKESSHVFCFVFSMSSVS